MKCKVHKLKSGQIALDLTCEFCGLPISTTSASFGMDCANHCSEKAYLQSLQKHQPKDKP